MRPICKTESLHEVCIVQQQHIRTQQTTTVLTKATILPKKNSARMGSSLGASQFWNFETRDWARVGCLALPALRGEDLSEEVHMGARAVSPQLTAYSGACKSVRRRGRGFLGPLGSFLAAAKDQLDRDMSCGCMVIKGSRPSCEGFQRLIAQGCEQTVDLRLTTK